MACSSAWMPEWRSGVGKCAQAIEDPDAQHRREQRAGEPKHDQQCSDVSEQ